MYRQKLNHTIRKFPDIKKTLQHVENVIPNQFVPLICEGRTCNNHGRQLLTLSVKPGGIGK